MSDVKLPALYMQVRAAQAGLEAARRDLEARLLDLQKAMGLKSGSFATALGNVTYRTTKGSLSFNDAELLEYAREHYPHEVVEEHEETRTVPAAVRPTLKTTLGDRLTVTADGTVVWKETGEVADWITWTPEKPGLSAAVDREAERVVTESILAAVHSGRLAIEMGEADG